MADRWLARLNQQFGTSRVQFDVDRESLVYAQVDNPDASGRVYLHGAHVTSFRPTGNRFNLLNKLSNSFSRVKLDV